MTLELREDQRLELEQLAARAGQTVSEYVDKLIQRELNRQAKADLEAKLLEGLNSGPATPMTRADWDDLRKSAMDSHARQTRR